jgi:cysteate synthase
MSEMKLTLRCTGCGATYDPPTLRCDRCDGLLRSDYATRAFEPGNEGTLFDFHDWLPSTEAIDTPIGPAVYRSERLAERLGLRDLAIAFNGYAPEIGATNPTGSFKDFEALPTVLYCREHGVDALILASAGNTARAFAYAATALDFPVVLVVPERALERLWLPTPPSDAVRLVAIEGTEDYAFAIRTADLMAKTLGIAPEGGARNVARRDGMGTAVLEHARQFGRLPMNYVQAIGSGTGGIAAWEAAQRLVAAGLGASLPTLHLAQNAPFTPIHDAWTDGVPIAPEEDVDGQLARIAEIDALVLANRTPPYGIPGGVRDALTETGGCTYAMPNEDARAAASLFLETEGVPIGPAAAVATAALIEAVRCGRIGRDDATLLHVTGNNELLVRRDHTLHPIEPVLALRPEDATAAKIECLSRTILP